MSQKPLEDCTFEELVDIAARDIMTALIDGGGKQFKSQVFLSMELAVKWRIAQDKRTNDRASWL